MEDESEKRRSWERRACSNESSSCYFIHHGLHGNIFMDEKEKACNSCFLEIFLSKNFENHLYGFALSHF